MHISVRRLAILIWLMPSSVYRDAGHGTGAERGTCPAAHVLDAVALEVGGLPRQRLDDLGIVDGDLACRLVVEAAAKDVAPREEAAAVHLREVADALEGAVLVLH